MQTVQTGLQDDREELQQVELELQRQRTALAAMQPAAAQDAADAPQANPALEVLLLSLMALPCGR